MTIRGSWMCVVSAVSFGLMSVATKLTTSELGAGQAAFLRFFGCAAIMLTGAALLRTDIRPRRLGPLISRSIFGAIAVVAYFLTIRAIGAGLATMLNFMSPVFSAVFSRIVLGEPLDTRVLRGLFVAILGVTLVVFGVQGLDHPAPIRWVLVGILSAAASGGAYVSIRIARRTDGTATVFTMFTLVGMIVSLPMALSEPLHAPGITTLLAIAAMVLTSVLGQLLMTASLKWLSAPTVGVILQLAIVTAFLVGGFALGEELPPLSIAGSALTTLAVTYAIWPSRSAPEASRPVTKTAPDL